MPMGGWAEEAQAGRHHDPVPEEGSEDELPPHIQKVCAGSGGWENGPKVTLKSDLPVVTSCSSNHGICLQNGNTSVGGVI